MIRVIIEHYISKPDINGNRYFKASVTRCWNNKNITVEASHSSEIVDKVIKLNFYYSEIYEVYHIDVPIRQFNKIIYVNIDNLNCW